MSLFPFTNYFFNVNKLTVVNKFVIDSLHRNMHSAIVPRNTTMNIKKKKYGGQMET